MMEAYEPMTLLEKTSQALSYLLFRIKENGMFNLVKGNKL